MAADEPQEHQPEAAIDLAGQVRAPTVAGLPAGYIYTVTRYADVILKHAFPQRFADLIDTLSNYYPTLDELRAGGGGRTVFTKRFDDTLATHTEGGEDVWGKRNIWIGKSVSFKDPDEEIADADVPPLRKTRGHEIDMFGYGRLDEPFPGVAVEMEWNNKDPFYDRDLNNFQALHREGAIAVGVIVTRGPELQNLIGPVIRSKTGGFKYGKRNSSSTNWNKLTPRVNLGGGGECPLFLVGIEPERIAGIALAVEAKELLDRANEFKTNWRATHDDWRGEGGAEAQYKAMRKEALDRLPPVSDVNIDDPDDED